MSTTAELMSAGMPARLSELVGQETAATGLTATGSTQATALVLPSKFAVFGTVAASTGAILPSRGVVFVVNGGLNALTIYPQVNGNINGGTTNAGVSVPAGKSALFISNGLIWGANISA